ncbi:glucosamine inositolphosphorylceramide transferase family protein [Heyndrickxia sp. NPDC080065]|uniref:glucosamine inositolphosphorylceramide transferase family protein n=1 Tax=Heyndrickxia sp. NPDC080065 TaxID=3390568 RepID=UPI003D016642
MNGSYMYILIAVFLILLLLLSKLFNRKIMLGIWSITVFHSNTIISKQPNGKKIKDPTLQASDVSDVPAEFVADPFIISDESKFYMFFEILDKSTGKGIIGLATSIDGENWAYDRAVLRENFHLSYPYVFKFNEDFYMIPESCEANKVLLYKAKNFPYEWEIACELIQGKYVDSSIFQYNNKWWMLAGKSGKLHLFYSNKLEGDWLEHPKSPLISNNVSITRPGGRVIVDRGNIYRYTQDGKPSYGSAVRVFKITRLSEFEYEEVELNVVLRGTKREIDWNKDGMHTIDQLKIAENRWLIAVDGHKLANKNYFLWKIDRVFAKNFARIKSFSGTMDDV